MTSLQREANGRFGFPAKMTLAILQRLYERHKVLTYPRTDSRALPEDYPETMKETLSHLQKLEAYNAFAGQILMSGWVKGDNRRIFDNKKISDHFAIVPTGELPKDLEETEQKIYDLVVRRTMAAFFPSAVFDVTTRETIVEGEKFVTEGKVLVEPGWMAVVGRAGRTQSDLCPITNGEAVQTKNIAAEADQTRPPARFTDATLLSAMESAGKKLDADELRDAMAEKGLGTPATRAQTIEGLIEQKYLRRDGRDLIPNAKAFQLMQLVRGLKIDALTQPRLTAEWEYKLSLIEKNQVSRDEFMHEIREMTERMVASAKQYEGDSVPIVNPIHFHNRCPACGGEIVENYRRYACTTPGCYFSLSKHPSGRTFEIHEVEELLANHRVGPLSGFMSRRGFPFEGELLLERDKETGQWGMRFAFEERPEVDAEEIASAPAVGNCPLCHGRVLDLNDQYVCEHAVNDPRTCTFRVGKTILQRTLTHDEVATLLAEGRTPLLDGFISKRTNRAFKSYLVWDSKKKSVVFEFEKREKPAEKEASDHEEDGSAKKTVRKTAAAKAAPGKRTRRTSSGE